MTSSHNVPLSNKEKHVPYLIKVRVIYRRKVVHILYARIGKKKTLARKVANKKPEVKRTNGLKIHVVFF